MNIGDKVRAKGYTKDDLGVGVVQELIYSQSREMPITAFVWWPSIKREGEWPVEELDIE